jgi:hypothetical protein
MVLLSRETMLCLIVRQAYEPIFEWRGEAAPLKNWFLSILD